jgi:hypothetical protein
MDPSIRNHSLAPQPPELRPALLTAGRSQCRNGIHRSWIHDPNTDSRPDLGAEQQLVVLLVRQLAMAEFKLANDARSRRLGEDAGALDIDPKRITALL